MSRAGAPPRIHVGAPLRRVDALRLPADASRHLQVLRAQPGDALVLFDGTGGEWSARVVAMGRDVATVAVEAHVDVERELDAAVTLAIAMPANDRMDTLVEKATELGVAAIQPLVSARSVLRPEGERGRRRVAHWRAIAVAACEQCGRNRVPVVHEIAPFEAWIASSAAAAVPDRWLLAPSATSPWCSASTAREVLVLSGPEGGFTPDEEARAKAAGYAALSLGPRVLRADTAPLVVLAALGVRGRSEDGPPQP